MLTRPFFVLILTLCTAVFAAERDPFASDSNITGPPLDFEEADQFIDVPDAVKSRSFVRRTILSNAVKHSSQFQFERPYLQHLLGFNAVFQRTTFSKFVSGVQGIGAGYVFGSGHAIEGGVEFSAISSAYAGYKFVFAPEKLSLWPFGGVGIGKEISSLGISDLPSEAQDYSGRTEMFYTNFGLMIPLVDVGLRAEVRMNFFALDRLILTSGIGAIVFL